ncbi:MAG: hypothetical protein RJQ10_02165 [Haliea sp.]|uniref:hypothetical protein n=1 Tax=Haliea sp. TaxID=1932666 RepID=UPI0032EC13A8
MEKLSGIAAGLALATLVCQPLAAGTTPAATADTVWVNSAFGDASALASGAQMLTGAELESATGRIAPLYLALSIAGVDLALMGFFWGVYVPHYGGGGSCAGCNDAQINSH